MKQNTMSLLPKGAQFIKKTTSLCPGCVQAEDWNNIKVDAVVFEQKGKVWMIKKCKKHGVCRSLYWSDYNMYKKAEKFQDQGIEIENPIITKTKEEISCPHDCGLCTAHESHTALGNIALTNRCDLRCWYCFYYAKEGDNIYEPTMEQIGLMLKNLKNEKPIGTNAVQLSLDANEKIFVKSPEGFIFSDRIGNFVDKIMDKKKPDLLSAPLKHEKLELGNWEVLTVDKNNKTVFRQIKSIIRHKIKQELFRIETNCGWNITATGSHSVFVFNDGEIIPKPVNKINENDVLLGSLDLPLNGNLNEINILDLIEKKRPDALKKIVVCGFQRDGLKNFEKIEKRKINWDSVSYSTYKKSGRKYGTAIRYFNSKKGKELPINLKITSELCRLLGYYIGEGCTYRNGVIFTFSLKEKKLLEDFEKCVKKIFGRTNIRKRELHGSAIQYYIEGYLYKVFFDVLGAGASAKKKKIPWIIFNISVELKKEFLKAYFKCDGNVKMRKSGFEINHNTVSKDLASDLVWLHLHLGLTPKIEISTSKPHMVKKTGQFIKTSSKKFRIVIDGKKELSKALWYLDEELKRKFRKYISLEEQHAPSYLRIPIGTNINLLTGNDVVNPRISYLLKRIRFDKSISKENLKEITDFFNKKNIEFDEKLNDLTHSTLGFFKVRKISRVKSNSQYVYDISIPDSEAFFAGFGPLLAHNTGGEPTLREDLIDIIKLAKTADIEHVQLNTNGINLAKKPGLARQVREAGVNTIYLSFDGLTPKTNPKNYWEIPDTLNACREAKIGVVLVPTVIGGINDHELGDIIRFGFGNTDVIRGINFQPVSFVGKMPDKQIKKQRITIPGAIKKIEEQTEGQITRDDFYPVPCTRSVTDLIEAVKQKRKYRLSAHFSCGMATYIFKDGDRMVPITRFVDVEGLFAYLDKLTEGIRSSKVKKLKISYSLTKLAFAVKKFVDEEKKPKDLKLTELLKSAIGGGSYKGLSHIHYKSLFLGMMHFQDPYNWDVDRVKKCCVHYAMPDGRIVPFCTFNVIPEMYRDKTQREFSVAPKEWEKVSGKKLSDGFYRRKYTEEQLKQIEEFYKRFRGEKKYRVESEWGA